MPEPEDSTPSGLRLPADDPAAPAVEALRAMASHGPVEASPELAAFLDDPAVAGSGATPSSRRDLVTVVRLPIRRAGRVAVAVGAALALAAIGGVAVAATGGSPDRAPAQVQQDDSSDTTTTTTEPTETETETATTAPDDSESADQDGDDQGEDAQDGDTGETQAATHTANPTAAANHHDGKGSDDEHADVHGGGTVDHRAEHSPTAKPGGGAHTDAPAKHRGGGSHGH
ncbi:hypothetical protein [Pedococcus bigeumensis]|uniref:hypothetical protein n=1 Tax=Pedococcus bigeumensis TaxID=433644 RepID=UPI002FE9BF1C